VPRHKLEENICKTCFLKNLYGEYIKEQQNNKNTQAIKKKEKQFADVSQ
jgi:hypothetical protein